MKFGTSFAPRAAWIVVFNHAGPFMSAAVPTTGSGKGLGSKSKNCWSDNGVVHSGSSFKSYATGDQALM